MEIAGKFIPFFEGDSDVVTPIGRDLLELQQGLGGTANVVPMPMEERTPGVMGVMKFDDSENVFIDPEQGGVHTAAHEIMHLDFPTDIDIPVRKEFLRDGLEGRALENATVYSNPKIDDATKLRYLYERESIPAMIEEASAQGGARAFTDRLGLGNIDTGFPIDPHNLIKGTDAEGEIDSLEYPLMYRDKGVDIFKQTKGVVPKEQAYFLGELDDEGEIIYEPPGYFQGDQLGIGIDPRYDDKTREEYYDIVKNARPRAQKQFDKSYDMIRYGR
jgi:hypothetical protein